MYIMEDILRRSERGVKRLLIIFLGSIGVCLLYGLKVRQVAADDVYILSIRDGSSFYVSDLLFLQKRNIDAAFEQPVAVDVSNGFRLEEVPVSAVNENFGYFINMQILQGAFFNEVQVSRKYGLAVVNESAAYQLFGSEDCVGQEIFLNQVSCKVAGIVREQGEEAGAKIYIPYTVLENLGGELSVEQLWCRFKNLAEAASVLDQMGYSLGEVDILQTNNLKGLFMQRFWIVVVLVGFYFGIYLGAGFVRRRNAWLKGRVLLSFALLFGSAVGMSLAFVAVKMAAYAPDAYELSGKSWRAVVYRLLDFYLMADVSISCLTFLRYWNKFSLLSFVICLISGVGIWGLRAGRRAC